MNFVNFHTPLHVLFNETETETDFDFILFFC